jgi:hypothetical protein
MFFSGTGFSREEAGVDTMDFCGVASDAFPSRTGFSRERAGVGTTDFGVWHPTASRVGPASAGKRPGWTPWIFAV